MDNKEFTAQYWKQYLMIEKEFKNTVKYVAVAASNYKSYSDAYAKLLLQIGSEVDVVAKIICKVINPATKADGICQYQTEICTHFPEFVNVTVACDDQNLQPWNGWNAVSPQWWKAYNGVKHNRNQVETIGAVTQENYKFANQGNVLNALAGLYQMEQYLYSMINSDLSIETPLPGSRLFILKDQGWEDKHFGHDTLCYVKAGVFNIIDAPFVYSDV